jgi:hypothetical protein
MSEREQPDPGDGWRLLKRGEVVMPGDHFKRDKEDWREVINPGYVYSSGTYWTHRRRIITTAELLDRVTSESDPVNAPPHYRQGGVECIDAIRAALTDEEFRGYCKGNAIKYTWREKHKGGNEDLKKAAWYLNRIETKEETQ